MTTKCNERIKFKRNKAITLLDELLLGSLGVGQLLVAIDAAHERQLKPSAADPIIDYNSRRHAPAADGRLMPMFTSSMYNKRSVSSYAVSSRRRICSVSANRRRKGRPVVLYATACLEQYTLGLPQCTVIYSELSLHNRQQSRCRLLRRCKHRSPVYAV